MKRKFQLVIVLLVAVGLALAGCESCLAELVAKSAKTGGGPASAVSLSGRWFQDGKPTSISSTQRS